MNDQQEDKREGLGKRLLFWGGVVFTVAAPLYIGLKLNDPSTSWVSFLIGAFVIFMSKFEDIVEFSVGPLRARMREKIDEADASLSELRQIAKGLAEITLTDLMASNFMGGLPLIRKLDFHDELMENLEHLGVTGSDREKTEAMWRQGMGVIYNRAISHAAAERKEKSRLSKKEQTDEEFRAEIAKLTDLIDFKRRWDSPTPAECEKFLSENGLMNEEAQAWIDDYRHYLETGEIRRRDLFATQ